MSSVSSSEPQTLSAPTTVDASTSESREERIAERTAIPDKETVEARVREYFADEPIMISIAWCESKFRHYRRDGGVIRGEINSKDVGVMQINEYYHVDTADALGLDLHELEDNLAYARYLHAREGTTPWNSSSHCWRKNAHIAQK